MSTGGSAEGVGETTTVRMFPSQRALDILFVVDNSPAMEPLRDVLARNLRKMISVLPNLEGGVPNVHIGVISTAVGTGGRDAGADCDVGLGDGGLLWGNDPTFGARATVVGGTSNGCGLAEGARWIEDHWCANGTDHDSNYSGDLVDVFSCLAGAMGTNGCGASQPLQALRLVLAPEANSANKGFLRENAYLFIIIISNQDDSSPVPVEDIVATINQAKPRPLEQILVSGVIPWSRGSDAGADAGACATTSAPRLKEFIDAYGYNGQASSVCEDDFTDAMTQLGDDMVRRINLACVNQPLVDADPNTPGIQPDCHATLQFSEDPLVQAGCPATVSQNISIPECLDPITGLPLDPTYPQPESIPDTGRPCWYLVYDGNPNTGCPNSFKNQKLAALFKPGSGPPGAMLTCTCLTCAQAGDRTAKSRDVLRTYGRKPGRQSTPKRTPGSIIPPWPPIGFATGRGQTCAGRWHFRGLHFSPFMPRLLAATGSWAGTTRGATVAAVRSRPGAI